LGTEFAIIMRNTVGIQARGFMVSEGGKGCKEYSLIWIISSREPRRASKPCHIESPLFIRESYIKSGCPFISHTTSRSIKDLCLQTCNRIASSKYVSWQATGG
jgi:hypothetical protein